MFGSDRRTRWVRRRDVGSWKRTLRSPGVVLKNREFDDAS
jgi:hypothetical protein